MRISDVIQKINGQGTAELCHMLHVINEQDDLQLNVKVEKMLSILGVTLSKIQHENLDGEVIYEAISDLVKISPKNLRDTTTGKLICPLSGKLIQDPDDAETNFYASASGYIFDKKAFVQWMLKNISQDKQPLSDTKLTVHELKVIFSDPQDFQRYRAPVLSQQAGKMTCIFAMLVLAHGFANHYYDEWKSLYDEDQNHPDLGQVLIAWNLITTLYEFSKVVLMVESVNLACALTGPISHHARRHTLEYIDSFIWVMEAILTLDVLYSIAQCVFEHETHPRVNSQLIAGVATLGASRILISEESSWFETVRALVTILLFGGSCLSSLGVSHLTRVRETYPLANLAMILKVLYQASSTLSPSNATQRICQFMGPGPRTIPPEAGNPEAEPQQAAGVPIPRQI